MSLSSLSTDFCFRLPGRKGSRESSPAIALVTLTAGERVRVGENLKTSDVVEGGPAR